MQEKFCGANRIKGNEAYNSMQAYYLSLRTHLAGSGMLLKSQNIFLPGGHVAYQIKGNKA